MLSRSGLWEDDDFGESTGTNFAFRREAVRKLWWAYVSLLLESGKIPCQHPEYNPDKGDVEAAKEVFFKEWMGIDAPRP